jgi:hypothetical protein
LPLFLCFCLEGDRSALAVLASFDVGSGWLFPALHAGSRLESALSLLLLTLGLLGFPLGKTAGATELLRWTALLRLDVFAAFGALSCRDIGHADSGYYQVNRERSYTTILQ